MQLTMNEGNEILHKLSFFYCFVRIEFTDDLHFGNDVLQNVDIITVNH